MTPFSLMTRTENVSLLDQVKTQPGPSHFGELVQEAVEVKAEGLVAADLKRMGWAEDDLSGRRKGDPGKVALAQELRSQTTMPLDWIAQRLRMGTRGYLAWLLQRCAKVKPTQQSGQKLLGICQSH